MLLRQILAAADDSEEGRAAITAAVGIAHASGGAVAVLTVTAVDESAAARRRPSGLFHQHTRTTLAGMVEAPRVTHAEVFGLPGIEICRFAEAGGADLIVMGRKRRTERLRLLIGDTADSVARRSALPCLFIPAGLGTLTRVIVALDGTERGFAVLLAAVDFTREIGGRLRGITVEPAYANEIGVTPLPTGRSARLAEAIVALRASHGALADPGGRPLVGPGEPLVIGRGPVVEGIIREIERSRADVLVVGHHRGGPAGLIDAGSVSRRLTHEAPCAVLTIPL